VLVKGRGRCVWLDGKARGRRGVDDLESRGLRSCFPGCVGELGDPCCRASGELVRDEDMRSYLF